MARTGGELLEHLLRWPEQGGFQIERLAVILAEYEGRLEALEGIAGRAAAAAISFGSGASAERAAVLAFLKRVGREPEIDQRFCTELRRMISQGEHLVQEEVPTTSPSTTSSTD